MTNVYLLDWRVARWVIMVPILMGLSTGSGDIQNSRLERPALRFSASDEREVASVTGAVGDSSEVLATSQNQSSSALLLYPAARRLVHASRTVSSALRLPNGEFWENERPRIPQETKSELLVQTSVNETEPRFPRRIALDIGKGHLGIVENEPQLVEPTNASLVYTSQSTEKLKYDKRAAIVNSLENISPRAASLPQYFNGLGNETIFQLPTELKLSSVSPVVADRKRSQPYHFNRRIGLLADKLTVPRRSHRPEQRSSTSGSIRFVDDRVRYGGNKSRDKFRGQYASEIIVQESTSDVSGVARPRNQRESGEINSSSDGVNFSNLARSDDARTKSFEAFSRAFRNSAALNRGSKTRTNTRLSFRPVTNNPNSVHDIEEVTAGKLLMNWARSVTNHRSRELSPENVLIELLKSSRGIHKYSKGAVISGSSDRRISVDRYKGLDVNPNQISFNLENDDQFKFHRRVSKASSDDSRQSYIPPKDPASTTSASSSIYQPASNKIIEPNTSIVDVNYVASTKATSGIPSNGYLPPKTNKPYNGEDTVQSPQTAVNDHVVPEGLVEDVEVYNTRILDNSPTEETRSSSEGYEPPNSSPEEYYPEQIADDILNQYGDEVTQVTDYISPPPVRSSYTDQSSQEVSTSDDTSSYASYKSNSAGDHEVDASIGSSSDAGYPFEQEFADVFLNSNVVANSNSDSNAINNQFTENDNEGGFLSSYEEYDGNGGIPFVGFSQPEQNTFDSNHEQAFQTDLLNAPQSGIWDVSDVPNSAPSNAYEYADEDTTQTSYSWYNTGHSDSPSGAAATIPSDFPDKFYSSPSLNNKTIIDSYTDYNSVGNSRQGQVETEGGFANQRRLSRYPAQVTTQPSVIARFEPSAVGTTPIALINSNHKPFWTGQSSHNPGSAAPTTDAYTSVEQFTPAINHVTASSFSNVGPTTKIPTLGNDVNHYTVRLGAPAIQVVGNAGVDAIINRSPHPWNRADNNLNTFLSRQSLNRPADVALCRSGSVIQQPHVQSKRRLDPFKPSLPLPWNPWSDDRSTNTGQLPVISRSATTVYAPSELSLIENKYHRRARRQAPYNPRWRSRPHPAGGRNVLTTFRPPRHGHRTSNRNPPAFTRSLQAPPRAASRPPAAGSSGRRNPPRPADIGGNRARLAPPGQWRLPTRTQNFLRRPHHRPGKLRSNVDNSLREHENENRLPLNGAGPRRLVAPPVGIQSSHSTYNDDSFTWNTGDLELPKTLASSASHSNAVYITHPGATPNSISVPPRSPNIGGLSLPSTSILSGKHSEPGHHTAGQLGLVVPPAGSSEPLDSTGSTVARFHPSEVPLALSAPPKTPPASQSLYTLEEDISQLPLTHTKSLKPAQYLSADTLVAPTTYSTHSTVPSTKDSLVPAATSLSPPPSLTYVSTPSVKPFDLSSTLSTGSSVKVSLPPVVPRKQHKSVYSQLSVQPPLIPSPSANLLTSPSTTASYLSPPRRLPPRNPSVPGRWRSPIASSSGGGSSRPHSVRGSISTQSSSYPTYRGLPPPRSNRPRGAPQSRTPRRYVKLAAPPRGARSRPLSSGSKRPQTSRGTFRNRLTAPRAFRQSYEPPASTGIR